MTPAFPFPSRRDKDRLYMALYARGGPGYHWAFITGPKPEKETPTSPGMRIHAIQRPNLPNPGSSGNNNNNNSNNGGNGGNGGSNPPGRLTTAAVSSWEYEARPIQMRPSAMILVRVVIAKIMDLDKVLEILSSVPVRPEDRHFDCRAWIRDALDALAQDTTGALSDKSKILDWTKIHAAIVNYVERKKAEHRFDGRVNVDGQINPAWSDSKVPTFDLLTGKEVFP